MKQVNCNDPRCKNFGGYGRRCGHTTETFTPLSQIKKESESMKDKLKVYRKEARKFITVNTTCKMNMTGCDKVSACVHHSKGREGDLLLDKTFWIPSCLSCNLQVELKDKDARAKDLKLSKFNKKMTNA